MGISIVLYGVQTAEKFEDLDGLEKQLEVSDAHHVDLYKMFHDLAVVFTNSVNPYANPERIEYRIIFGNQLRINAGGTEIGGFIPSSEVKEMNIWLKSNGFDSKKGFFKKFDALSEEVKLELEDLDSADPEDLYVYVKELTEFYATAEVENNSVVICAE